LDRGTGVVFIAGQRRFRIKDAGCDEETRGILKDRATGSNGRDCEIEIGNQPWFPELLKTTGNFGLGLLPISSRAIIQGLQKISSS
jgi:hypothetical protein